jgi:hypothetical protein
MLCAWLISLLLLEVELEPDGAVAVPPEVAAEVPVLPLGLLEEALPGLLEVPLPVDAEPPEGLVEVAPPIDVELPLGLLDEELLGLVDPLDVLLAVWPGVLLDVLFVPVALALSPFFIDFEELSSPCCEA